ncbi:helix-turn-helix domain-containing protein [Streptomyces roseoviridis]|uniref:Helix-turn-helix domain-containing protein n=1 Tax=Streptomyces roseoviridis TaxID=67361 RepID=A0ABV5QXE3_9ACTN
MGRFHTVEQVADLLGLHVKTVRGYVRDGRLPATRVGRQYRIRQEDLDAFTGSPGPTPAASASEGAPAAPAPPAPHADVSSIVQVDGVDRRTADRLANAVMATALGRHGRAGGADADRCRLRVETVFDEERASLKFVVLGDLATTAGLLKVIDALIGDAR